MAQYKFNITGNQNQSINNIVFPSDPTADRFDKIEIENATLKSQLFLLHKQFQDMVQTVPLTVDKLLDSRLDDFCNEKGSQALFLMERQSKKLDNNLKSSSISNILHYRANLILTKEEIEKTFFDIQSLRYYSSLY